MLAAFKIIGDSNGISDTAAKILYGVFTAACVLGFVTMALLRRPPSSDVGIPEKEPQSHWAVMGNNVLCRNVLIALIH